MLRLSNDVFICAERRLFVTQKAREVLQDCRLALRMLEADQDDESWRVHWAAAVALIRTVGSVLDKVDGDLDAAIKAASNTRYREWRTGTGQNEMFTEFIEKERNNLLKEYKTDVHPLPEIQMALQTTLRRVSDGAPLTVSDIVELDKNIYRPILDGPWEGDDARDVLSAAIDWWQRELNLIDKMAATLREK